MVVTNVVGSVTSNIAVLAVIDAARFTAPPSSRSATIGDAVTFSVTAAGAGPLSYEWKRNGQVLAGATGSTFNRSSVALSDRGFYEGDGGQCAGFKLDDFPIRCGAAACSRCSLGQQSTRAGNGSLPEQRCRCNCGRVPIMRWHSEPAAWSSVGVRPRVQRCPQDWVRSRRFLAAEITVSRWLQMERSALGETTPPVQAVVPAGLGQIVAVAAGYAHNLALRNDGTVVAWGKNNTSGQCKVPADLTGVVAVAAGSGLSVALKSDGTIVAWGFAVVDNAGTAVPSDLGPVQAIPRWAHRRWRCRRMERWSRGAQRFECVRNRFPLHDPVAGSGVHDVGRLATAWR